MSNIIESNDGLKEVDNEKNSLLPLWAQLRAVYGFADAEEIDNIARQVQLKDEPRCNEPKSCAPGTSCLFTCLQGGCTESCTSSCTASCTKTCTASCTKTCTESCTTTCETTCTMSCQRVCISGHSEAALQEETSAGGES